MTEEQIRPSLSADNRVISFERATEEPRPAAATATSLTLLQDRNIEAVQEPFPLDVGIGPGNVLEQVVLGYFETGTN